MNKTALITGASSGIGEALAKEFASRTVDLVLVARSEQKLNQLAKSLEDKFDVKAHVIVCDLSTTNSALQIMDELNAKNLNISYLVNNAGFGDFNLFKDSDLSKQQRMISVNIAALTELTHCLLPEMLEQQYGRILNVASTVSFLSGPYMSVYFATKAYVLSFSEALASELTSSGVTVTALCPGATESGFQEAANLTKSTVVKMFPMPSSERVASYGVRAMMSGKRVAIQGLFNWLMCQLVRFVPRRAVTGVVKIMIRP